MQKLEVSAKVAAPDEGVSGEDHTVVVDFPENVEEAVDTWGDEVTFQQIKAAVVVSLQSFIRGLIKQKKSQAEIQEAAANWKPGIRARGKTPQEKILEQFAGLSADEKKRLLEQFMQDAA